MTRYVVHVADLVPGLFVTELDHPWLGTPFLMQGFFVDGSAPVEDLRRLCATVDVDRRRSHCQGFDFASYAVEDKPEFIHDFSLEPETVVATDDFLAAALRHHRAPPTRGLPPPVSAIDGSSSMVAEMLYASSIVDDVRAAMSTAFGGQSGSDEAKIDVLAEDVETAAADGGEHLVVGPDADGGLGAEGHGEIRRRQRLAEFEGALEVGGRDVSPLGEIKTHQSLR